MRRQDAFILAGVSALAMVSPARAQEAESTTAAVGAHAGATSDASVVTEIIVQARRRDESLQDVPLVVNAVTADSITKLNIRNFTEINAVVPGLQLTPNANGIGTSSSIRGVNHDVNVSAENGTIQYYRNDAPVPSNFVMQTMYDVGQIEVLRGPQGTLRGRSTPSGSITATTRQPDLVEAGGYMAGTLASASAANINGALNIPIISDVLGIRVAGLHSFDRGNRVTSVNSDVKPSSETNAIRAAVRFEPTQWLRLGFLYEGMQNTGTRFDQVRSVSQYDPDYVPSAGAPDYGEIGLSDRLSVQTRPSTTSQKFQFYNWNAEVDVLGQRLIYVGSATSQKYHSYGVRDLANFFPDLAVAQIADTKGTTSSHEVRLQNLDRVAGLFDYVAGYFHYAVPSQTNLDDLSITQLRLAGLGFPIAAPSVTDTPIYVAKGTPTEDSFFGNVTFHLTEATELSGGLRRIHFTDNRDGLFISCTPEMYAAGNCTRQNGTQSDVNENATIYSASIKHRFTPDLMVYASTGSSWRPPVVAIGNFTHADYTANEIAHISLPSESSKSYEIGLKSDWFDRKVQFNLTAYHQDYKNYPYRSGGAGIAYININSAGAPTIGNFNFVSAVPIKVNGVEAELAFTPTPRWNLGATVNFARSRIGNALLACTDALNNQSGAVGSDGIPDTVTPTLAQMQQAYGGERVAQCAGGGQSATFQPEWSGVFRAEYTLPLNNDVDGYLRGLFSWKGKSRTDSNNPYDNVKAYGLLNLFGGLRAQDGGWEVSVYAKNIFDTTKLLSQDDLAQFTSVTDVYLSPPTYSVSGIGSTVYSSRYAGVAVTAPREFGVTFRVAFGSR
ncbi:TonB-dependent receptor [Sphingomonas sp. IC081]|uniref:TonB-dependent receptor n=1 Tax=Sphingomonas sp. IC081 TaxID=304378 RepID=UPI00163C08CD|nr:TonB-dependent receptor [Sphingomonas sp. IC081]